MKIKFGLYGCNGHQIQGALACRTDAEISAAACIDAARIPKGAHPRIHPSLGDLLADDRVQAVSLCSPLRISQAGDALRCMEAGKHVYAEKPCAMTEEDLDSIIATSKRTGMIFHEMAATAFSKPYAAIRRIVADGQIGTVVQILSQKSYPWGDWRPKDEKTDGGLAMQAGIYNCRFIEHVAGTRIKSVSMKETKLCNHGFDSECRRAASFLFELENGGIACGVANYCCPNPEDWGRWGYESLRIFGSEGFVECVNCGETARIAARGKGAHDIDVSEDSDYLGMFIREMISGRRMIPFSIEEELSPTRWAIRAKMAAKG